MTLLDGLTWLAELVNEYWLYIVGIAFLLSCGLRIRINLRWTK